MSWNNPELQSLVCINKSSDIKYYNLLQKPIEIYAFIDPLASECWSLEPYLKKLSIEYEQYFTIRQIIVNNQFRVIKNNPNVKHEGLKDHDRVNGSLFTWAAYAIKSAELQGKNAGRCFLRRLQVAYFIKNENIQNRDVLLRCAQDAKLDIEEFERDLFSDSATRALKCDYNLSKEMNVYDAPTIVFFNSEDQGVKVSGIYPYEIYVHVLGDMLQQTPIPRKKPTLEEFLAHYQIVSSKEISVVFDWPQTEVERNLRKLQLKQKVIRKISKKEVSWKYIGNK